jgi:DNA segregation ATPase FtsK/SpoIIIE-like protein
MRLAIVGKTRSGKSTALHHILSHALRHQWAGILLLDGKGCELHHYATLPGVTYYGMEQIAQWATALEAHVTQMATCYRNLVSRGLREAADGDPRWLIVADEVQQGTRDDDHGKAIRKALMAISEQGAALGDMLVIATQREINAIPPSARANFTGWLRLLGQGYFHLQVDGQPTLSGRTSPITPAEVLATIQQKMTQGINQIGA